MEISERIKYAIESSRLTLRDLEKITGIPNATILRYKSGTTDKIPVSGVIKIANATGVSPEFLMGWDTQKDGKAAKAKELLSRLPEDRLEEAISFLTYLASKEDKKDNQ